MHQGSPARVVVAGLFLAALAAAAVWNIWSTRDTGGAVAPPPASGALDAPPPTLPVEPVDQPVGPATGDYAELATAAELEHPDTDPHIRRWYDRFGFYVSGESDVPAGIWTNKEQLWDSIAPDLRDQALGLGPAFNVPLYDGDTPQPAVAVVRWSTTDTQGLGELVDFRVTYRSSGGRVLQRTWPVLIGVLPDNSGRIIAEFDPYDLRVTDYPDFASLLRASGDRSWAHVEEHRQTVAPQGMP